MRINKINDKVFINGLQSDRFVITPGEGGISEVHTASKDDLEAHPDAVQYTAKFQLISDHLNQLAEEAHFLAHNSKRMIKAIRKLHLPVSSEWKNARLMCRLKKKEFTGL